MTKPSQQSMKPFEIWTACLPNQKQSSLKYGRRPVVIISGENYGNLPYVSVIPLSKNLTAQQLPSHVLLCNRFLTFPSRALCEQVTTLEKSAFIRRIGYVDDAFDRFALRRALSRHLNLVDVPGFSVPEASIFTPMDETCLCDWDCAHYDTGNAG